MFLLEGASKSLTNRFKEPQSNKELNQLEVILMPILLETIKV